MKKSKMQRLVAALLAVLTLALFLAPAASAAIVGQGGTIQNIFLPQDTATGRLILRKEVRNALGEGVLLPAEQTFDFKIELGAYYAEAQIRSSAGILKADAQGAVILSVPADGSAELMQLEPHTTAIVTELLEGKKGYELEGENSRTVSIPENGAAELTFINVYTPAPVSMSKISLRAQKTLQGRNWSNSDRFTFILEQKTAEGWQTLARRDATKDGSAVEFGDLLEGMQFALPGNYQFRLFEQKGSAAGMTYDTKVYTLTVAIADGDGDGALEISSLTCNGQQEGEGWLCTFINRYQKNASGDSPDTGESFPLMKWICLLVVSGFALVWLLFAPRFWKTKE